MEYQVLYAYLLERGIQLRLPYNYLCVWHDNDYDLPYVRDSCWVVWWGLIK